MSYLILSLGLLPDAEQAMVREFESAIPWLLYFGDQSVVFDAQRYIVHLTVEMLRNGWGVVWLLSCHLVAVTLTGVAHSYLFLTLLQQARGPPV